ncbi:unnamed protein product [Boreogadus saida]
MMYICGHLAQGANPTSYREVNLHVPILRLYYGGGDLKRDLRLSRETITALIAMLGSDSDHGNQSETLCVSDRVSDTKGTLFSEKTRPPLFLSLTGSEPSPARSSAVTQKDCRIPDYL